VVALHHSGKPEKDADGHFIGHDGKPILDPHPDEADIKWVANEGVRTSRIVADFLKRAPQGELRQSLEATFDGRLKPPMIETLESDLATRPAPLLSTSLASSQALDTRGMRIAENGFVVMLPLNVAVKVESLVSGPPAAAPLAAPAVVSKTAAPTPEKEEALSLEKLTFDRDYSDRRGYDEAFLGQERLAPMPSITPAGARLIAPARDRGKVLHYHHYSAMVHTDRRMPALTACNADYTKDLRQLAGRKTFGKDEWIIDERMDPKYQLPRGFYDRWKRLDYGHLVRREDNCWGASAKEIEYANSDSFHLTNCTPQHEAFNRSNLKGIWGNLENHIGSQASSERLLNRLCIFAGPIFGKKDLLLKDEDGDVYVPLAFWKVVVAPTERGALRSFGFVLTQGKELKADKPFEEFTPEGFEEEQKTLEQIEKQTIVRFSAGLKKVDAMLNHPKGLEVMPLSSLEDVWLGRL
jgi:endonuclease G